MPALFVGSQDKPTKKIKAEINKGKIIFLSARRKKHYFTKHIGLTRQLPRSFNAHDTKE